MKGVYYTAEFKCNDGTTTTFEKIGMPKLLTNLEYLMRENYGITDRLTNQVIYNLINRPKNASRLNKLFIKVRKWNPISCVS